MGKEREQNYKEQAIQLSRIAQMKEEGKDEYDIKKQVLTFRTILFRPYKYCICFRIYLNNI